MRRRPAIRSVGSRRFNATTTVFDLGSNSYYNADKAQTLLVYCNPAGAGESNIGALFNRTASASSAGPRLFVNHNSGNPTLTWGQTSTTANAPNVVSNTGFITYGQWTWIAASCDAGVSASTMALYVAEDGHPLTSVTIATPTNGSGTRGTASGNVVLVGNRSGSDRTFNGDIAMVAWWHAQLTKEEIERARRFGPMSVRLDALRMCWANGYDFARQRSQTVTASARGTDVKVMIRADGPTYRIKYAPAGAFFIDAQPAAFSVTAFQAGLIAGRAIDAQPASFSVSATQAGLIAGRGIDAQPASYSVSATQAGLIAARFVNAQPASYAVTAFDADLVYTVAGSFFINAEPASFDVTATDAGLIAGRTLDAQPASFTISATQAGLIAGRGINAQPAAYSVTAFQSDLVYTPVTGAFFINAEPASFVVTAYDATLFTTAETETQLAGGWGYKKYWVSAPKRKPPEQVEQEIEQEKERFKDIPEAQKETLKTLVDIVAKEASDRPVNRRERLALRQMQKQIDYDTVGERALTYETYVRHLVRKQEEERIVAQIIIQLLA